MTGNGTQKARAVAKTTPQNDGRFVCGEKNARVPGQPIASRSVFLRISLRFEAWHVLRSLLL
ncbi:MAG: hypothetical protein ACRD4S_01000 [Candidatus Acidiferrales bacterium]